MGTSVLHPPNCRSPRTRCFRSLPNVVIDIGPSFCDTFAVILQNQSQRGMVEADQGSAIFRTQAILHIRNSRIGHEQGPGDFEQRRPFDSLHYTPEVAVIAAQVAVPSAARPRLEFHRHRPALGTSVMPSVKSSILVAVEIIFPPSNEVRTRIV